MAFDHNSLLTLARKTEAAAEDGDPERIERAALRLFEALVEHVGAEHPELVQLSPSEARLLKRGQQRIIDLLIELSISAQTPETCHCDSLANQLIAQLTLQAADEHNAGIPPLSDPANPSVR